MDMVLINNAVMWLYYAIAAFFLVAVVVNFVKTKDPQNAVLYCIVMMPFEPGPKNMKSRSAAAQHTHTAAITAFFTI